MKLEICILLSFLVIGIFPAYHVAWEYCKPEIQEKLCDDKNHTVCDPSKAFDPKVSFIAEKFLAHVPITRKVKRELLRIHNFYRNRVASGEEVNSKTNAKYPKASRMRELIWDDELMYVSHIHTLQVRFGHDYCRNTQRFPYSGQNLGWRGGAKYVPVLHMIEKSLEEMYLEKDLVPDPPTMPKLFSSELKTFHVGHFTQMTNDRVSRVGCACSVGRNCVKTSVNPPKILKWCYYLGCNYDATNIIGDIIYKTADVEAGEACIDWETTTSTKYTSLCRNNGGYFATSPPGGKKKKPKPTEAPAT